MIVLPSPVMTASLPPSTSSMRKPACLSSSHCAIRVWSPWFKSVGQIVAKKVNGRSANGGIDATAM